MNCYSVFLDNGKEYDDYVDMRYFIIAKTEEESMVIAAKLWNDQFGCNSYNISSIVMRESDNGIPLNI
jgi:hypothetical protein